MSRETAAYLKFKRLWALLPDDKMKGSLDPTRDECVAAIIAAADLNPGDFAGAGWRREQLLACGALKVKSRLLGGTEYVKGEFPEPKDPSGWVADANARIAAQVRTEQALRDRERQAGQDARIALNASTVARQKKAYDELIDARLRELGLLPQNDEPAAGRLATSASNGSREGEA
jgi:hypothetical protein